MNAAGLRHRRIAPTTSAVAALFVDERDRDVPGVALPRPEIHIVARFGTSAPGGLDIHAMGVRQRVHRKVLHRGQRAVTARLRLDVTEAILGVPASALTGRIVALQDLWGDAAARRLLQRLADAPDLVAAAAALESALAERRTAGRVARPGARLALVAADRLSNASVNAVAGDLGVSDRHLRRVFREALGLSPKTFARLARFRRALRAARAADGAGWAGIAASTGYYDQAHLIAEFRAIAGVTPQALVDELRLAPSLG
ncbi:MAG TPA: helix-turn-helix domain-containing protein [Polyangia bacterium]|nr:helix-turn-helix domain-containing protein [Polyangia bacterium]